MTFTANEKWKCAERELALRKRVYPRQINEKKLALREARYEIELMHEIAEDYRRQATDDDKQGELTL